MNVQTLIIPTARKAWKWQWQKMMNSLAPADSKGSYQRPKSEARQSIPLDIEELSKRNKEQYPKLIIGSSCPWAHRTWILYQMKSLEDNINLIIAKPNHINGLWEIEPSWNGCKTLLEVYKLCKKAPNLRATVPVLINQNPKTGNHPIIMGNQSSQLIETLNSWPSKKIELNLAPDHLKNEIHKWEKIIGPNINDGVYKCGFAHTQNAYNSAIEDLFNGLKYIENSLSILSPWLCGEQITLADIKLFTTLIRWEIIYAPLFKCLKKPLQDFPRICRWRESFFNLPNIANTCNKKEWENDYYGALFPLNPSNIVPSGPELNEIIKNYNFR